MSCLEKILCGERVIIGIRDYDNCTAPESRLFINDLPGMSLKKASKIASGEYPSGYEILKKCTINAAHEVFQDFQTYISPYFDFNLVVETRQLERFSDTKILPAVAKERGLIMKRWRSELSQIYVEEIYIKANASGVGVIKITDGATITTQNVDLIADEVNTVFINKAFKSEIVKITMDDTSFPVYTYENNKYNSFYKSTSCRTCSGNYSSADFYIAGWDGSAEDNKCYGIGVKASVRCYEENVICSVLPRMYFIIWYKSGVKFFEELLYTDRLNGVTIFTKDEAAELLEKYEADYAQKYKIFCKSIYDFLKSTKGECLTCNGTHYAQNHP